MRSGASLPGVENLQVLAKALNVSCDELITGRSPQPPQPDGLEAVKKELLAEKQRRKSAEVSGGCAARER